MRTVIWSALAFWIGVGAYGTYLAFEEAAIEPPIKHDRKISLRTFA